MTEIAASNKSRTRQIASIKNEPDEAEFVKEEIVVTSEESAKSYYHEAKNKCYQLDKEMDCLQAFESAVTHFPESNWTGESLVFLTEFYHKTKRITQAKDILKILKKDFKHNQSIQNKVEMIERNLL